MVNYGLRATLNHLLNFNMQMVYVFREIYGRFITFITFYFYFTKNVLFLTFFKQKYDCIYNFSKLNFRKNIRLVSTFELVFIRLHDKLALFD